MITFIICSIAPERAHALEQNIQRTIGETPYEIIIFDNRQTNYSIAKAYNLCASKARYAYLCFLHEDIAFHSRNWGKDIIHQLSSDNCGIIGFSACSTYSCSVLYISFICPAPFSFFFSRSFFFTLLSPALPHAKNCSVTTYYNTAV